jgi:hypothetical protein
VTFSNFAKVEIFYKSYLISKNCSHVIIVYETKKNIQNFVSAKFRKHPIDAGLGVGILLAPNVVPQLKS